MSRRAKWIAVVTALATAAFLVPGASADNTRIYEVTIENLTGGQPLSPAVAVTHDKAAQLFTIGKPASAAIEAIAEDGDQGVAVAALTASQDVFGLVYDVVDVGEPLTPAGTVAAGFDDTVTFQIAARPGDRLSLATMLICTNDGFTGLRGMRLPGNGTKTKLVKAYDAGTEFNTEASEDIVDPCSGLGPVPLAGDPNGNENDAVDSDGAILPHPGMSGGIGDLLADHDWDGAIARVTVTRISG